MTVNQKLIDLEKAEIKIFEGQWSDPDFRACQEEPNIKRFFETCIPFQTQSVIDLGCGNGHAAALIFEQGLSVCMVDIAANCLDPAVEETAARFASELDEKGELPGDQYLLFELAPIWDLQKVKESYGGFDFAHCVNVIEEIPDDMVELALQNIHGIVKNSAYFEIAVAEKDARSTVSKWVDRIRNWFQVDRFHFDDETLTLSLGAVPKGRDQ